MTEAEIVSTKADRKQATAWLADKLWEPPQTLHLSGLQDDLLIGANGVGGGLFAITTSTQPILRRIDHAVTTGIWLDQTIFVRSILDPRHMNLFVYHSESNNMLNVLSEKYKHVHDVRFQFDRLFVVSTGTNEVVQLALNGTLLQKWKFPGEGDVWHLNCMDLWRGRCVISCFGRFEKAREFSDQWKGEGLLFDLETEKVLWDGLSLPHTPRLDSDGCQYICDSGTSRLLVRQPDGSAVKEVRFPGAFPRGLAFGQNHIYVGLSAFRSDVLRGLDLPITNAKVSVLDRESLDRVYEIDLPCQEIYDIVVTSNNDPLK